MYTRIQMSTTNCTNIMYYPINHLASVNPAYPMYQTGAYAYDPMHHLCEALSSGRGPEERLPPPPLLITGKGGGALLLTREIVPSPIPERGLRGGTARWERVGGARNKGC